MEFYIITTFKKITKEVDWLDITTTVGGFIIQPEHAPMVASLKPDSIITLGLVTGKQETIKARHGIIRVERNNVTMLGDIAL